MHCRTTIRLLGLMTAVAGGHADASEDKAGQRLIGLRTNEIVQSFRNDKDAQLMTRRLGDELKASDAFNRTVLAPCPPSPAPAPRGKVPLIAAEGEWKPLVLAEATRLAPVVASKYPLSDVERQVLVGKVVPAFGDPGSPDKFTAVLAPACPKRGPKPKGKLAPTDLEPTNRGGDKQ
jgi:hypothetical protein